MEEGAFDLTVDNVKFDLWDDGTTGFTSDGDYGVYVYGNESQDASVYISRCYFSGGFYQAYVFDIKFAAISGETFFDSPRYSSFLIANAINTNVSNFTVDNFYGYGFYIGQSSGTGKMVNASNFQVKSAVASTGSYLMCGAYIRGHESLNMENFIIKIENTRSSSDDVTGIEVNEITNGVNTSNGQIWIDTDMTGDCFGAMLNSTPKSTISSTEIYIDDSAATKNYGIYLSASDKTKISACGIDLVNSTGDEIGIYLSSTTDDCYGDGNITINCGTNVDDTNGGTGNNIGFQAA
jgi:hypothetical protein